MATKWIHCRSTEKTDYVFGFNNKGRISCSHEDWRGPEINEQLSVLSAELIILTLQEFIRNNGGEDGTTCTNCDGKVLS